LPNTIEISNVELGEYTAVNSVIESKIFLLDNSWKKEEKSRYSDYKSQYEKISNVIAILNTLRLGLYVIISIFVVSIGVIIYSIIWNFIYYYKEEIYITKLVWGNNIFIYWPFSLQWIIYSLFSFVLATWFFILVLNNINFIFETSYSFEFLFNSFYATFFTEASIFTIIWALSWYFSSKKYIDNN